MPDGRLLKTGYVKLSSFSQSAAMEMENIIQDMENQGVQSYILDLQNNPEGLVTAGLDVSQIWLDGDETLVNTVDRDGNIAPISMVNGHVVTHDPLVVLVNEASASASEILAGALHDNGRAILVGHKTSGKGNIQSVTQLHDGSTLSVTVAKYLSPALHEINQVGITPDVQLSGQEKFRTLTSSYFKCAHGIILESLHYGIAVCRDGALYRKIGKRISEHAEKFGYGVVDHFVGHGIGTVFHSEPLIFHHPMPKIKRFKNPLKSANGHASSSTTPVAQDLPVASTNPSQSDGVPQQEQTPILPQQEQAPILPSNSSAASLHPRPSARYWRIEAKDSENAIKQINVKVNEVNNLTVGECIIVDFDAYNSAYGDAQGLLAGYCGSLAIDCNLFPISFERWSGQSGMPKKYMEDCFETILKPRFLFRVSESIAYRYCNSNISKKWATHRQRLWNEYFDPARSKNEIISNVPSSINKDQWASFVAYRQKPSTIELCRRNKEIQRKQKMPKANSRRRYEMFLETGKAPSRGKMFIETHKRKNGSFVNAEARTIGEQIESHMTHCNTNESEVSPEDIVGKILGAEHSGRVRCMGMGASPSNTFLNTKRRLNELSISSSSYGESSATSTYLHQKVARLVSQVEETLTLLKNYMISKEGWIPKELATMFSPQPPPVDREEIEMVSPMDVRGSSADNNANHQSNA